MPFITPSTQPPNANAASASDPPFQAKPTQPSSQAQTDGNIPIVTLATNSICAITAARIATSLLGHVLFLKGQVPFPVQQLSRLPLPSSPKRKASGKAFKARKELLISFDTLSSHLASTFRSLSTALARNVARFPREGMSCARSVGARTRESPTSLAYLAIILGPSVSAPKARVILGLDGLEVGIWGLKEEVHCDKRSGNTRGQVENDKSRRNKESDEEDGEDAVGGEVDRDVSEDDDNELPISSDDDDGGEPPLSDSESDSESSTTSSSTRSPPFQPSHAQIEQTLRKAERLLASTLASHDGGGTGGFWMADEIAPTQTHILLHAPRRFQHPSWVPKLALSSKMDSVLDEFLSASSSHKERSAKDQERPKHTGRGMGKKGKSVEGVWISAQGSCNSLGDRELGVRNADNSEEDDEMIWWAWDAGKMVGFVDW